VPLVEFENPVLRGMHPDPTVCRVGRDFYLACSSFEYFPGVPIYHSRDLVEWHPIGHALTRSSQLDLTGTPSSGGIYAPTLRYHDGTFFLVTTHVGRGHFLVTAPDPRGPWSDPCRLDADGIDPSLAFLDGRVYYTRNGRGSDPDHPFVYQSELESDSTCLRVARRPRVVWRGTGGIWPEAPHLYQRGDWYYLLTAEGGTSYGHSVVIARSRRPYGPFEASPHGPLLTHRDRPRHPIQATGHADLVDLEDGSTWAVLLGVRPTGGRHHHLGRETFLAPVRWEADAWPRMGLLELRMEGPPLRRRRRTVPPRRTEFRPPRIPPEWAFVRNPSPRSWSLSERPGFLRLWGTAATLSDVASPALVCRRQQHLAVTARARLTFDPLVPNEQAGICVRASDEFHVALVVALGSRSRELRLVRTLGARTATISRVQLGAGPVTLEVEAAERSYAFRGGTERHL
jgi:xylan 1,4-beta-xylosidase